MLTLVIFCALVGMIMLGVPIFAAMGLTAAGTFIMLGEAAILPLMAQRMYVTTTGFTLLAIPFFILAGNLMNAGGITLRVFRFARVTCGYVRGGLGYVNVIASMIFSGMCGSAVAEAAGLGGGRNQGDDRQRLRPRVRRRNHRRLLDHRASDPALDPGRHLRQHHRRLGGEAVHGRFHPRGPDGPVDDGRRLLHLARRNYPRDPVPSPMTVVRAFFDSVLALFMPVLIIGGILGGIFTPTEAAVVASVYALVIGGLVYREISLDQFIDIVWESVKQSVRVLFIISTAGFFGWLMVRQNIPDQVILAMTSLSTNKYVLLMIVIFILLVLGCFMEGIAVIVITVPIFIKLVTQYDIDPVQFGMVVILCSMIGLLTPPVGMSLFAVCTISGVGLWRLSWEVIPYLIGIFAVTLVIAFVPEVSTWLPNLLIPQ